MLPDSKFSTAKKPLICRHVIQSNWAECKQGTQPVLGFPFRFVNVLWDRLSWVPRCRKRGNTRNGGCVVSQDQCAANIRPQDCVSWRPGVPVFQRSQASGHTFGGVGWTLSPALVIAPKLFRVLCFLYKPLIKWFRLAGCKCVCQDVCVYVFGVYLYNFTHFVILSETRYYK